MYLAVNYPVACGFEEKSNHVVYAYPKAAYDSNPQFKREKHEFYIDKKGIKRFYTGQELKDVVTQKSMNILEKAAKNSSNIKLIITSTIRSTRKQAEVMYTNESNGNHIRYAAPGREVIQVFKNGKAQKLSKETIINNMDKKIIELGNQGRRVSLHCISKETYANNIIDIFYTRGVTNKIDLTKELAKDESVTKAIHPFSSLGTTGKLRYDSKEPAIHVEIKQ